MSPVSDPFPASNKRTVGNSYRLGVLLSALAAGMLFLIYLACIAVLPYLLYKWGVFIVHTVTHLSLPTSDGGLVAGKLVFGFILLVLMVSAVLLLLCYSFVKPWFSRKQQREFVLPESGSEALRAFVQQVATQVGAPMPQRILLNTQLNAAASIDGGVRALLRKKLVLTIGLPLVESMTVAELGGVLAHEFGHFTQRSGMLATWLVRSVGGWFRQAFEDQMRWDRTMEHHGTNAQHEIAGLLFYLAKLLFWCSTLVARLFFFLSRLTSSVALRQMEFDADQAQLALIGPMQFRSVMQILVTGDAVAAQSLKIQTENLGITGTLCSDVVRLHRLLLGQQTEAQRHQLWESELTRRTKLLDTHPALGARLAGAEKFPPAPSLVDDNPACMLFNDWSELTEAVTKADFGAGFPSYNMPPFVSPEFLLGLPETPTIEAARMLELQGLANLPSRHWHLAWEASLVSPQGSPDLCAEARQHYKSLCSRRRELIVMLSLAVVGKADGTTVSEQLRQLDETIASTGDTILPGLTHALSPISCHQDLRYEPMPQQWLQLLDAMASVWPKVLQLEEQQVTMQTLLDDVGQKSPTPTCYKKLTALHQQMQLLYGSILKAIGSLPVPESRQGKDQSVKAYTEYPGLPPIAPWPAICIKAQHLVGRLMGLPVQALAELTIRMAQRNAAFPVESASTHS